MRPASEVLRSIQAQLAIVGAGSPVTLDSISVAYYDGNRSYLEPAYRFTATVHLNGAAVDHVIGYEPIAVGEPEPLPTLGPSVVVTARSPGPVDLDSDGIAQFVARGPMPTWNQDAQAFEQGILSFWPRASGSVAVPFQVGSVSAPRPFTSAAGFGAYANSARVLESEAPGSRGHFTTDRYCCGAVTIARIGGLGAAGRKANGMTFWIARTPSLVASPDDSAAPYNEWLSVFAGLHGVLGYRTDIYSNDGVAGPFGADLAMGAPVVSAWLLEGAATSAYRGGENPLYEGSSGGLRAAPSGRVSTLSACGHDGDTMHDTASLPRTTCLQSWWLEE
jgi:hypothetical protein